MTGNGILLEIYRLRLRVLLALFAFHCPLLTSSAQEEPEYRLELGAGAGTVTYLGDYNGHLLKGMQPWGSAVAKYKMNPRMALALTLGYGKMKGSADNIETWYPQEPRSFNFKLASSDLCFEYNFWAYGTGQEYRGAKRLTPFVAIGLGLLYHGGAEKGLAISFPLGAGIKYKVADRLNLAAEWRMHFTQSDMLDGMTDPYGIKSNGLFKNTDCFSVIQASLTYDLWAKCKTCNNDRY